jgi:ABC-type proline/glycine betaine transport system permease subunit
MKMMISVIGLNMTGMNLNRDYWKNSINTLCLCRIAMIIAIIVADFSPKVEVVSHDWKCASF